MDALYGYLLLGSKLLQDKKEFTGAWNFAPHTYTPHRVSDVVEKAINYWGSGKWKKTEKTTDKKESAYLNLDSSKARRELGWDTKYEVETAIKRTIEWYKKTRTNDVLLLSNLEIEKYQDKQTKE